MLGGFLGRKGDVEAINRREDERQQQRELSVFQALSQADDPEVRALALTGILHSAQPRTKKSGLRGWMGEMEASPFLPQIQALVNSPVTEQKQTLPSRQIAGGMAAPSVTPALTQTADANAPAAQPNTALTEQKGQDAPPMPTAIATQTSAPPVPYTVSHPRQVFMDPMEKFRQQAIAKAGADVEGDITGWMAMGLSREQAIEQVRAERLRRSGGAAGSTYAEGNVEPDPLSPTGYSQILYLRADPTKTQRIPAQPPNYLTRSLGQDFESIAKEIYPSYPATPLTSEQVANVNKIKQQREVTQAGNVTAARAAATNKALTERWLTPEQASNLGVPFGTNMAALQGFTPLTDDQRKRKDAVVALAPQVTQIEQLIKQVIPPGVNALQASAIVARKRASRDPQMAQLEGEINRAVGNIARVLAAESGRLTQQDVERASKSLADLQGWTDTQESALARLNDVQTAMDRILGDLQAGGEPALRSPQGPPVPGSLPQPKPEATAPPPPRQLTVPGLFVGVDGQLHTGSPSGPVYNPSAAPGQAPVPFTPQAIRPVR